VYPWSATVTVTKQGGGQVQVNASGYVPVVVRDSSVYGAGFGIDGIPQLFPISANGTVPAGLLWVSGDGSYRFFTGSGPYTNPEDFGSLVKNGNGTFTYTSKTQTAYNFSTAGLLTSVVYPTGLQISYTITGSNLTGVTAPDGGSTSLSYDTHGFLYKITEPGSRVVNLTQTEVQTGGVWQSTLTQVQDVDNTTRSLGYDSAHHLTSDSWSPLYTSMTFSSITGLLTGVTRGQSTTVPYTIVSAASAGLGSTSVLSAVAGVVDSAQLPGGSLLEPGLPLPAATLTDGNNHTSSYYFDPRGRLLQYKDALGNLRTSQLNAAGDVVRAIDALGRVTVSAYNSSEDLTQTTNADGSFTLYQYDPKFHEVTQTTDSLGNTSTAAYDQTTGLMTSSADALGNTRSYVWSNGRLQSQTDPLGHTLLYRYDTDLRQTAEIESLGNWTLTGYDNYGNESTSTSALGWVTQTTANGRGLVTATTDANGNVVSNQYYADGELNKVTNARGYTRTITIDARGLTTSTTDNLGNATTFAFDSAANPTSVTDPDGNKTTTAFLANNWISSVTDPVGNQTQYTRDADSNITATTDPAGNVTHTYFSLLNQPVLTVDPLGNNQFTVFDPAGNAMAAINQIGAVTRILYDADIRPTIDIDALGNQSRVAYDADGNVVATFDGLGYKTLFLYTADNQRAAVIDPNSNVTRSVFNAVGEIVQTIDGNGHTTTIGYDMDARQNSVTDPNNNQTQTVFSVTGATLETIDGNSNVAKAVFDGDDRPVTFIDPLNNTSREAYDPAGNELSFTDAAGHVKILEYTKDSQLATQIDANGHQQEFVYTPLGQQSAAYDGNQNGGYSGFDANGNAIGSGLATNSSTQEQYYATGQLSLLTDPDGNQSRFLMDLNGNPVATIDPLGHMAFVARDADYRPTLRVDADGRSISYSYDPGGRETAEIWSNAAGVQQNAVSHGYDHANNMTSANNNYGAYSFTYDAGNRVQTDATPFSFTLTYGFDHNNNVTSLSDTAGATLTSFYNPDNFLTSRRLSGGPNNSQLRFDLTYTSLNQIASISRYADTAGNTFLGKTQWTYDPVGNVSEVKHTNASNTVLEDFTYSFDSADRLLSQTDTISGTPATIGYGYDSSGQLTSFTGTNLSYDANGDRTQMNTGLGTTNYTGAGANQIASDGTWNFKYDPEGNLVEKDGISNGLTWKYGFDNLDHLLSATEYSSGTVVLQVGLLYDAFGSEVEEDVTQSGTTTVSKFAFDLSGNAFADLNSSNQIVVRRVWGDAVGQAIARINSDGTEYWYLADHLGSVRGLANNSGALADAISYDAFGNVTSESAPSVGDRFKFADGQWDSNLGLYHIGARWYDPVSGRWLTLDPARFLAGDANLYRYVSNNPGNTTDPSGMGPGPLLDALGNDVAPLPPKAPVPAGPNPKIPLQPKPQPPAQLGAATDQSNSLMGRPTAYAPVTGWQVVRGILSFVPVVGGALEIIDGIVDGRPWQVVLGILEVGGDILLLGAAFRALKATGRIAAGTELRLVSSAYCFVAGTPVLIPADSDEGDELTASGLGDPQNFWIVCVVVGIGLLSYEFVSIQRERKRRAATEHDAENGPDKEEEDDAEPEVGEEAQENAMPCLAVARERSAAIARKRRQLIVARGYTSPCGAKSIAAPAGGTKRPRQGRYWPGWVGVLLLAFSLAALGLIRLDSSKHLKQPAFATATRAKAIEELRVGERVWAGNWEHPDDPDTDVDPRTWRHLTLAAQSRWADGTIDDINVETLQPPEWVTMHKAEVGTIVPVPIDLVEMGMPATLKARVVANKNCPPIRPGAGRVILTTINHLNAAVHELTLEDSAGHRERIRPTTWHKFCRDTDGAWVSTRDFSRGDKIRGKAGALTVISNVRLAGVHRVYNMTIDTEHVYRVSVLGALVHNPDCTPAPPFVYRAGGRNPGNFRARPQDGGMVSGRDSLTNPWPLPPGEPPPLPVGKPIQKIDTSRLPPGTVHPDGIPYGPMPPGHVSIGPNVDPNVIRGGIVDTIPGSATGAAP
jgi:RHS repeat-associated protein